MFNYLNLYLLKFLIMLKNLQALELDIAHHYLKKCIFAH